MHAGCNITFNKGLLWVGHYSKHFHTNSLDLHKNPMITTNNTFNNTFKQDCTEKLQVFI
jgi:hypothetical protein